MDDDGQERESRGAALGSSRQLGQTRCGVKPSSCRGMGWSTISACSCQTQQAFSNLLWWWDRSLLNTSGSCQSVCCGLLPLTSFPVCYTHRHTHTMTSLLVWKNAPRGAAHPKTQLCLCLKSWWIAAGNLKSLQLSDLYLKWGQLEYAPFNANYMHSWIPYHLVNATPNCQGLRAPESTETREVRIFFDLDAGFLKGSWEIINT